MYVNVLSVQILDNPAKFGSPFQFLIHFECLKDLEKDLEWKVIYVGSADNEKYDQVLDSVLVGPVRRGSSKFVFQAPSPEPSSIPNKDLLGVTVVLLTCSYADQEFIKIGYYLNNEYENPEWNENPPEQIQPDSLMRNILADKPRVTRFEINWDA